MECGVDESRGRRGVKELKKNRIEGEGDDLRKTGNIDEEKMGSKGRRRKGRAKEKMDKGRE